MIDEMNRVGMVRAVRARATNRPRSDRTVAGGIFTSIRARSGTIRNIATTSSARALARRRHRHQRHRPFLGRAATAKRWRATSTTSPLAGIDHGDRADYASTRRADRILAQQSRLFGKDARSAEPVSIRSLGAVRDVRTPVRFATPTATSRRFRLNLLRIAAPSGSRSADALLHEMPAMQVSHGVCLFQTHLAPAPVRRCRCALSLGVHARAVTHRRRRYPTSISSAVRRAVVRDRAYAGPFERDTDRNRRVRSPNGKIRVENRATQPNGNCAAPTAARVKSDEAAKLRVVSRSPSARLLGDRAPTTCRWAIVGRRIASTYGARARPVWTARP